MFTTVKALTINMDNTIKYYKEGVASKDNHSIEVYNEWLASITSTLQSQIKKLKEISTNQKLIDKYETIINELLSERR
jgi:endonuclease IV